MPHCARHALTVNYYLCAPCNYFLLTHEAHLPHTLCMTFAQWLEQVQWTDLEAAKRFSRDRAHINKLRHGKSRPSYELMLLINEVSKGKVGLDTWQR